MTAGKPPRRRWIAAFVAALLLQALLVQPDHPGGLTRAMLLQPTLELPVILLALLVLGTSRLGVVFRFALTGAMTAIFLLKTADFGMQMVHGRPFDPVSDVPLLNAAFRMIDGAFGRLAALGATVVAALLVIGVVAAVWWATGVWARIALPTGGRWLAALGCGVAAILAASEARLLPAGWNTTGIPGIAGATHYAFQSVREVQSTLAGLREFTEATARDGLAGQPVLFDAIDRDVLVIFIESYGRASLDTPFYAERHRATLEAKTKRLEALGLAIRSAYLSAPTRGGQSWLSHATFANGLWVNDQSRYRALLASERQSLFHIARRNGLRTAVVAPAITMPWPEAAEMGFDTVLAAKDLGYNGKPFNWVTMPDQFTLAALDRLLRHDQQAPPLFAEVPLVSSHAPWVPVPDLLDWEELGDGRIFDEMATSGDPPRVVWSDPERVQVQYRKAVDYSLRTVFDYAALHADDPPLMIVLGDHQTSGTIAQDERPDVPIHVIGPPALVTRIDDWGWRSGLVPAPEPVVPMDRMRDMILRAFTTAPLPGTEG
ncbi:sulfatase-like hydrolase/transferase [Aliiruegeria sabulilitoris]|uniref:sulfatase-like hydrolase/transferase n=1 Tax=Aliiruegeria sabulilitoris TaxID=1510458 RepID=UPI0008321F9A|nr:sulfatase-like hydrolase/transferase [Aliiruegeria sabulilitoris]NDR55640.1 LTA synthase family protein [Pseudoruegeria sp. M32A2M]